VQRRHLLWATLSAIAGTGAWAGEVLDRPARISALADQRLDTGRR
jgi:hypothetical protein